MQLKYTLTLEKSKLSCIVMLGHFPGKVNSAAKQFAKTQAKINKIIVVIMLKTSIQRDSKVSNDTQEHPTR